MGASQVEGADNSEAERSLRMNGVKFLAIPAILALIRVLAGYVSLIHDWNDCAEDIVGFVAMLLRHFNQQSYKLVLGGHAVQLQLKKINATHLALCCQCCAIVEHIVPSLQENLCQILQRLGREDTSLDSVVELSKFVAEFSMHKSEVFDKLSFLLLERYDAHGKTWFSSAHSSGTDESGNPAPHEAAKGLAKDINAMYAVLSRSLNTDGVQRIFSKAFADISTKFEQRLAEAEKDRHSSIIYVAPNPPYVGMIWFSVGDRFAIDLAYLQEQLGKLAGIAAPVKKLLSDLLRHLETRLTPDAGGQRELHESAVEELQRSGKLPR